MEPLFANRTGGAALSPTYRMGKTRAAGWITCTIRCSNLVIDFIDTVAPGERFVVAEPRTAAISPAGWCIIGAPR